jgi:quercetin dioxygenase-like cupin family protein
MSVLRWNRDADGPPTENALRRKLESLGYRVSRYLYPPGTFFPPHTHDQNKIDAVVSGTFRITLEDGPVILEAGDAMEVPRGLRHSAEVVGSEAVVSLDAVKVD